MRNELPAKEYNHFRFSASNPKRDITCSLNQCLYPLERLTDELLLNDPFEKTWAVAVCSTDARSS